MFPSQKTSKNQMWQTNQLSSVSRIKVKKLKVPIYARKTLLFLLKIEGVQVLKKCHMVPKNSEGGPFGLSPTFANKLFGSVRDSNPSTPAS